MKKCLKLFSLFIVGAFIVLDSYAQQGNDWYFGLGAGITFNTNPPSALLDGQLNSYEGCASICDNNGNLLFYTDGVKIWNKQHQVMPNGTGLKGDFSASNSAIIIPRPGSASIFYIFTAGAVETNNEGYFFSEVDMSLQGGLGDVTATKNVPLYAPSTEKLTAVRHSNGIDVWVITKVLGNTEWKVYKVDCSGVNTIPVISLAGHQPHPFFNNINVGCLKSSPDGTKIAAVNTAEENWDILQFDASTGILSNGIVFLLRPRPYGVEFSPDSKLVYVGSEWLLPTNINGGVFQYNLATYDSTAIESSKTLIGTSIEWVGALQLGPDNKIYCATEFMPGLGVINSPNLPGTACGFVDFQVDLGDRLSVRGLPVFFPGLITNKNADFNYTINPDCATANFSATTSIPGNVSWQWDFGDGITGTGQNITHAYTSSGLRTDTVRLTVTSTGSCGSAIAVKQITINPGAPVANFGFDKECGNLSVDFSDSSTTTVGNPIQNWSWDFGDGTTSSLQNPSHVFTAYGSYTIKLTVENASGCISTASIEKNIVLDPKPAADFINTGACINQLVSFTDNSSIASGNITNWHWDFGNGTTSVEQNPTTIYTVQGSYTIKHVVESAAGCISDTAVTVINIESIPVTEMSAINGCQGQAVQFTDSSSIDFGAITKWNWEFGDGNSSTLQNPSYSYTAPGNYTVKLTVQSANGCVSDTFFKTISVEAIPDVSFTHTAACIGEQIQFTNNTSLSFGTITGYTWNFGEGFTTDLVNPVHTYNRTGDFTVALKATTVNGCIATSTKTFHIAPVRAFAGNDTTVAIGQPVQLQASGGQQYVWSPPDFLNADNIFNPIAILNKDQRYTVQVTTTEGCVGYDDILIRVLKGPDVYVPSAFAPNGKNRIFRPILVGIQELNFFSVYNRWGQLIFTTREPGKGWDGKINGVDQSTSTFIWMLKAKDYNGRVITKKGTVTLIR